MIIRCRLTYILPANKLAMDRIQDWPLFNLSSIRDFLLLWYNIHKQE